MPSVCFIADPPSAICMMNVSNEVRLAEEFAVDVDVMDQFDNPCKNVQVAVSFSCANSALKVLMPTESVATDADGRFRLSAVQFIPRDVHTDGAMSLTGTQVVSLLVNGKMKTNMNVTVSSGTIIYSSQPLSVPGVIAIKD